MPYFENNIYQRPESKEEKECVYMKNILIKLGIFSTALLLLILAFYLSPQANGQYASQQEDTFAETKLMIDPIEETEVVRQESSLQEEEEVQQINNLSNLHYWHKVDVEIDFSDEIVYVVFLYTNITKSPVASLIYGPEYSYFHSNIEDVEDNHTQIVFQLRYPQKGTWHILLLDEVDLGTYAIGVYTEEEYEQMNQPQGENIRVVEY